MRNCFAGVLYQWSLLLLLRLFLLLSRVKKYLFCANAPLVCTCFSGKGLMASRPFRGMLFAR